MSTRFFSHLRELVRKSGYDVVRYTPTIDRPFPVLPMLVRERLAQDSDFFFVQIGANDGILDDPLRDLILEHHLHGLLVEPLPDLFEKLKENYDQEPQLRFANVAIVDHEGTVPIFRVRKDDPSVPLHWHGIASFEKRNLISQGVPENLIETSRINGTTLHLLLEKQSVSAINLLQIDTEGYDDEIVRMALQSGLLPGIIQYEHCWLQPRRRWECKNLLASKGYRFIEVGKDTVAIL